MPEMGRFSREPDPQSLPQDPVVLQRMLVDLTAQLDKTQKLLRELLEAKHHTKSEQLSPDQLQLFLEELKRSKAASKDDDELPPPDAGSGQAEQDSRPRGGRPLSPHLKRQRIEHDLSAEEKHYAGCQQDLHLLGEETSERYDLFIVRKRVTALPVESSSAAGRGVPPLGAVRSAKAASPG